MTDITRIRFATSLVALSLVFAGTLAASRSAEAQGVRCSAFLHERDGSWRSFEAGAVVGPRGELIEVQTGQRFHRGHDFVARLLDAICQPIPRPVELE